MKYTGNNFNKELKSKEFKKPIAFQNKILLIASDFNVKNKTLQVYYAEVDKKSGELLGDWKDMTSFRKKEKNGDIDFKIIFNQDETTMIVVSTILEKEKISIRCRSFIKTLQLELSQS